MMYVESEVEAVHSLRRRLKGRRAYLRRYEGDDLRRGEMVGNVILAVRTFDALRNAGQYADAMCESLGLAGGVAGCPPSPQHGAPDHDDRDIFSYSHQWQTIPAWFAVEVLADNLHVALSHRSSPRMSKESARQIAKDFVGLFTPGTVSPPASTRSTFTEITESQ